MPPAIVRAGLSLEKFAVKIRKLAERLSWKIDKIDLID